jgi:hypothetical protein
MINIRAGLTSQTIDIFIPSSASSTGAGLTGLVFNSASLTAYYRKGATGTATAITLATQTVGGAYSSGGFVEIDATNMPGMYRLDLPNAAIDTAGLVHIQLKGATNMAPVLVRINCDLVPADTRSVGGTTQTARDLGASVLLSSGTGTGQISLTSGLVTLAGVTHTGAVIPTVTTTTTATNLTNLPSIPANWLTAAGIAASALNGKGDWNVGKTGYSLTATTGLGNQTANITGNLSGSVGSVTGAVGSVTGAVGSVTAAVTVGTISANVITDASIAASALNGKGDWNIGKTGYALTATTGLGNQTANITGNLSGSVGSVTGAVGSVTGNVGGNVTGSVGSVTGAVGSVTAAVTVGTINANVITATSIATGAITAAKFAAGAIDAAALATDAVAEIADGVWDEVISGHLTAGSTGNALNAAGSAGDPWSTSLPGAYGAGTAGNIIGNNLNATVSSRLASASYTAPLDASGVRSALGMSSPNLDTQLSAIDTVVDSILADTGTDGVVVAAASKSGYALSSSGLDAITIETGLNMRQATSLIAASAAGKLSGAATTTITIDGAGVNTDRIVATVDADGNRTAVTLSPPA